MTIDAESSDRAPSGKQRSGAFAWRPGLDGLRGVAILVVVLVHFKTESYVQGGSFGVDLFFVLSGFLITTLLLQEWQTYGSISLRLFYARRALRLLPAFIVFCLVFVGITVAFNDYRFTVRPDVGEVLTSVGYALSYALNWPIAFGMTPPPGLGHLWSLSVEEQYYLLWPGILLVLLRLGIKRPGIIGLTLLLIICSALTPLLLPDAGWRRLNYGSDLRAQELLAGSLIAQLLAFNVVSDAALNRRAFRVLFVTAGLAFLVMVLMMNKEAALLYQGGFTFLAVVCVVLVLGGAYVRTGVITWVLRHPVLVYLGRRSYALYLWHMPISVWLRHLDTLEQLVCAGLASVAAAELSYRLVESPALRLKTRLSPSVERERTGSSLLTGLYSGLPRLRLHWRTPPSAASLRRANLADSSAVRVSNRLTRSADVD